MTIKHKNKNETRNTIPIRRWLIIPNIVVLLVSFGIIGSFFIQASIKNSLMILDELQSHMEEHINEEIIQRFERAEQLNQVNEDMFRAGILNIESQEEREIYFSNIFKSYPEMAMSFIGLPDGSFYGARRDPEGKSTVVRNNKSTNGASQYYSIDKLGIGIEFEEEFPNFDPRTRPWYLSAVEEGRSTYSDVYMHFVFKEPTITSSRPIYDEDGQLIGVFGADYLLTWMDEFLDKLLIGKNGQIFITDDEDRILASSLDLETYIVNDDKLDLLNINEANNEYIEKSIEAMQNVNYKGRQGVLIDGKKYYTGVINLDKGDLKWKAHLLVMEDDFLGNTKTALSYVVLLIILSILISIGIFAWLAGKITKPIEELTRASEKISNGHLKPIENEGKIDELYRLTNSFNKMGKRLSNMVDDLESKVASRTHALEYANKELEKLSFIDGLTGIYNRRKFDESYSMAWNNAKRHGRQLGIMMIDIDFFKKFNDSYGHLRGDDCLKSIANKLVEMLRRSTDLVARYGGEEFVILFQEFEKDKVEAFADKIRKGIEELRIEHSSSEFEVVTISIGIAYMIPSGELDSSQLIENADKALYKAKNTGRNKISTHGGRKVYLDRTEFTGAIGITSKDTEIIPAGTTIYSMDVAEKNQEYQRYAKDYDIQFIFDDNIPSIKFYTVPQVDIMAVDSRGGYIGTIGQQCDLESDAAICYINKNLESFIISENGSDFLSNVESWRDNLKPYGEIDFYSSKEEAKMELEFIDLSNLRFDEVPK